MNEIFSPVYSQSEGGRRREGERVIRLGIAFCFLLFAFCLFAQQSPVAVDSKVNKNRITIGDTVRYTVQLSRDEKAQVRWPKLGANLGMFEIRDYHQPEPRESKGRISEE